MAYGKYHSGNQSAFGAWLKKHLKEKGMLQKDLADELGISDVRITQIVTGNGAPSISTLVAICDLLEIADFEEPLRAICRDDLQKAFWKAA